MKKTQQKTQNQTERRQNQDGESRKQGSTPNQKDFPASKERRPAGSDSTESPRRRDNDVE